MYCDGSCSSISVSHISPVLCFSATSPPGRILVISEYYCSDSACVADTEAALYTLPRIFIVYTSTDIYMKWQEEMVDKYDNVQARYIDLTKEVGRLNQNLAAARQEAADGCQST